jgi:hypothetical protein
VSSTDSRTTEQQVGRFALSACPHHQRCISMESCIHSAAIRHKQDL